MAGAEVERYGHRGQRRARVDLSGDPFGTVRRGCEMRLRLRIPSSATGAVGVLLCGLRSIAGFLAHFDPISTMHAHAHLGGVGFFTMLIVGVSYKLIPMFTLSEVQSRRRAVCSIALLNVGLAGSFVTILLRSPLKLAFALLVVAALAIYGWEIERHPAGPQTPRVGLGHQILFDSHRASFAAVRAGRRAVLARFATEHIHRTT